MAGKAYCWKRNLRVYHAVSEKDLRQNKGIKNGFAAIGEERWHPIIYKN